MSTSAAQLTANRANAKKSTGPRTPAGKKTVSLNSVTHGLAGQTIVRRHTGAEAYDAYSASMLPALAPANAFELDLAQRIIHDAWRLNRAGALDDNLLRLAAHDHGRGEMLGLEGDTCAEETALQEARGYLHDAQTFKLLTLYEQRIQRTFERNLALLKALQKDRLAAEPAAAKHAAPRQTQRPAAQPQPLETVVHAAPAAAIGFARSAAPTASAPLPAAPPPLNEDACNHPEKVAA